MKQMLMGAAMLLGAAAPAMAHEVWIEQDATGPTRIYLGEPHEETVDVGEHGIAHFKPVVFTADSKRPAALTHRTDHVEAAATGAGDVRAFDDTAFKPWTDEDIRQGAKFHARAGRSETIGKLDFELVPTVPDADSFTVMFLGKPLADADVTIVTPDKWRKSIKADANGVIAVPDKGKGRYIVAASTQEDGRHMINGEPVARVHHVTTITYVTQ